MNATKIKDTSAVSNQHQHLQQTQIPLVNPSTYNVDTSNTSLNHTVVTTRTTERMTRPMTLALLPYRACIGYTAYCMLAFNAIRRATRSGLPKHNRTHHIDKRTRPHGNLRAAPPNRYRVVDAGRRATHDRTKSSAHT